MRVLLLHCHNKSNNFRGGSHVNRSRFSIKICAEINISKVNDNQPNAKEILVEEIGGAAIPATSELAACKRPATTGHK